MPTPSLKDMLEQYSEDIGLLINEPIEATTTNPSFIQDEEFPGAFLEENSPVRDTYEYEDILTEEGNATTNATIEIASPTDTIVSTDTGSSTGY
tara:strand:+ start:638 stop:919 length:282 start_codon:yes stop_codon:yes gene_type:complete